MTTTSPKSSEPPVVANERISDLFRLRWTNPILISISTGIILFYSNLLYLRHFQRLKSIEMIQFNHHLLGKSIKGKVTSVGDADNFRLYHLPLGMRNSLVPTSKSDLKDQTLHIRLAGVDAPELAHFGNPAQPYSSEALDWLTRKINGKRVRVELYSKDRFGRIVGMAYVRPFPYLFQQNVSEEMLKVGLATVYKQAGAVHAGLLSKFEALELKAQSQGVGMWKKSKIPYESPAQYKRRVGSGIIK